MRYFFEQPLPSTVPTNMTDDEHLDLTSEDMDALDMLFDNFIDAEEYNYFYSTARGQQELRF